jgi:hypothetical protein
MTSDAAGALSVRVAGLRGGDLEGAVANNASIYGLNAVVLATFAGLSAYNPALVGVTDTAALPQLRSPHTHLHKLV